MKTAVSQVPSSERFSGLDVKLSHPHLFVEATALDGAESTAHEAPVADASDGAEVARQA